MIIKTSREGSPNRIPTHKTIRDIYKIYMSENKGIPSYELDWTTYKGIIEDYLERITHHMIFNYGEIKMSRRLGSLKVRKFRTKTKTLKYNYGHYLKTGEKLYHLNEHTNGFYFRFFWHRNNTKNCSYYGFEPNRTFLKRVLSKHVNNTPYNKLFYNT